jgi:Domain of unknown function (DUF1924)
MTAPRRLVCTLFAASSILTSAALSETPQSLLEAYAAEAKAADAAFAGFSAERGETLFRGHFTTGKPDTPSCTTCHTTDPRKNGQTRAGKDLDPMAASVNPKRYSDRAKTEKWFGRNCNNVLGRECTPVEKGDFISFMLTQ